MKKGLKCTLVTLLSIAVVGCGAMSVVSGVQWGQAKKNVVTAKDNLEDARQESADSEQERQKIRNKISEENGKTFQIDESLYKMKFAPSENQQSVACVYCTSPDGVYAALGSSYAVASDLNGPVEYFVTNGHVVQPHMEQNYSICVILENNQQVPCEVVFYQFDANLDMAVVKLSQPTTDRKACLIRSSSSVQTGEKCTAIGYPDKSRDIDPTMNYDIASQTVTSGVISKADVVPNGVAYHTFQHDSFISHGNSGGPLFDENGFVIGMNTLIHKNSENVNFAIHSDSVKAVLDEKGIPYLTSEDYLAQINAEIEGEKSAFEEEKEKTIKKLNKELEAIDEASDVAYYEERVSTRQNEVEDNKLMMFIFAGGAAVCLIGLLVVLFVRGGGEVDDGLKSYLVCTRGVFAGMRYEVTKQTMTIGRDRNTCTIVFPEETPGISSNHCSIYFDMRTKTFALTDNGSTYGTYLADGRKLTKGVPESLEPGSTFALADKANEFKVERG